MSSRGSNRGGRGARAGRGARGASATAASPSARQPADDGGDSDTVLTDAPGAARAVTIESASTATQSSTPAPTPAPASSSGRARFKPKNVRRDAAERQKLEDARTKDLQAKLKIEEKVQRDADRRAARRGGGRGRGRGDAAGHFIRRTVTGSGAFSGISQDLVRQSGGSWGSQKRNDKGVKEEAQSQYGIRYQDRRANDIRVNIDTLRDSLAPEEGLSSDSKSPGVLPVGIVRVEHKEEEVKVATSAELEAEEQEGDDDDELFVNAQAKVQSDVVMADDNEVWDADPNQPKEKNVKVKSEPGTEGDDIMEIDLLPPKPKEPQSPELKKKALAPDSEIESKAKAKEKKRERALQDSELQALAIDAAALLNGLTLKEGGEQERDNKLFVFQLPPILPPLVHLNADGQEVVDLDETATVDGVKVKADPDGAAPISTASVMPTGGGYIGRLNVRKSGKVELDWGGRILDVGIATETDFLTTAIIVDEQENDLASGAGIATGMGEVFGKFVATPIFEEEADWEPDLEALGLSV